MAGDKIEDAAERVARILSPGDQEKRAFLDRLGQDYPEPRAAMEGDAFVWLRQWWSPAQIEKFIVAYSSDEMVYPGIINTSKGPDLEKYMIKIGDLAFGAYARTLPRAKMLEMVAGRQAAHGEKFKPPAERSDLIKKAIMDALKDLPESKKKQNIEVWTHVVSRHLGRFIEHIDEFDRSIEWISPKGKVNTTTRKDFQNRCARYRKKI